jgi:gluconate 2-dehydrogenase gamma chain
MGGRSSYDDPGDPSRRSFLLAGGEALTGAWLLAHWPSIAAAGHHAEETAVTAPDRLEFFSAAEAVDVDALCAQIVPSGATAGAREARALYFIDHSLSTYFSAMAPGFRTGLTEFQSLYRAGHPDGLSFGKAGSEEQIAHLKTVDQTAFFDAARTLTVLGVLASPKYGGNYRGSGWKMLGFVDQHAFAPPFGYYDREYTGFVPYAAKGVT